MAHARPSTTSVRGRLALLASLLAACSGGGGGAPPEPGGTVLDQLGVPTSREAPRGDAAARHPLGKPTAVFEKRTELYLSGVVAADPSHFKGRYANQRQVLLDDVTSAVGDTPAYAPIFSADASLDGWTEFDSASAAADLDGDGLEEVVILYVNTSLTPHQAFLRVIRHTATGVAEQSSEYPVGDFTYTRASPLAQFANLQLAAGDVDGDGGAELAAAIGRDLVVLDWSGGTFRRIGQQTYRSGETRPQLTTVAVGNVDADPQAEIVVFNGVYDAAAPGRFYVYSHGSSGLVLDGGGDGSTVPEAANAGSFTPTYPQAPRNLAWGRVSVGDLDGDGRNEIVFAGDVFVNALSVTVARFDPVGRGLVPTTTGRFPMGWSEQFMPVLEVMNADGLEAGRGRELLAYRYILYLDAGGKLAHKWGSAEPFAPPLMHGVYWDKVAVGDFTADGRDEVAYLWNGGTLLLVFGLNNGVFGEVKRLLVTAEGHHSTLCAVNIDRDSTVVRYTGEYELLWSNPQIVAVMAAPPYYTGQDAGAAETALTFGRDYAKDTAKAVGFYAGLSVGYSAETPFWGSAGSSKVVFTVEGSLDWTFSTGSSEGVRNSYAGPGDKDQVVFAATPIDVYHYEIVSSPQGRAGERISVQVPRTPWLTAMDRDFYDAHVPAQYRVPAGVLSHRIGDPWSYPSREDMLLLFGDGAMRTDPDRGPYATVVPKIVGGFRTPDPWMQHLVPGSSGKQGIELSNGASSGFGTDFNLQVGVEFENVSGGFLVGGKAGFHYGYSHSFTTTDTTAISGWIPGIPPSMKSVQPYSVGLFAHPWPTAGAGKFVVVNYWVE